MDELILHWRVDDINPENYHRIFEIRKHLKTIGIPCKKYNYSLDEEV